MHDTLYSFVSILSTYHFDTTQFVDVTFCYVTLLLHSKVRQKTTSGLPVVSLNSIKLLVLWLLFVFEFLSDIRC